MKTFLKSAINQSLSSEISSGSSHEIGCSYQSFFSETGLENSREIGLFFREFASENPAKFDFFFRDLPEALTKGLRDVMGQFYPIHACTRANHVGYSSVHVTYCGSSEHSVSNTKEKPRQVESVKNIDKDNII